MKIQFIGMQGSGKTTQAKLLAKSLNVKFYGVSTLLKEALCKNDPFITKHYSIEDINKGNLAPDIVINYIVDSIKDESYVMEGYLRTPGQAETFCKNARYGDFIIDLFVSEDLAIERMKNRNRSDDNDEAILNRLKLFKKNNEDIIRKICLYSSNGYMHMKIEAKDSPEEINNFLLTYVIKEFS